MKLVTIIYTIYAGAIFILLFLLLFPTFFVLIQIKSWQKYTHPINKCWARVYFKLIFMPVEVIYHQPINKDKPYIYCPNHFSYLDIPSMGFTPGYFSFVGKISISKVPLFGYMFKKLHIPIDRDSLKSRYTTYQSSKLAIKENKSLVIFPEGGIRAKYPPNMHPFKEGAFRIAIEQQIPIIPVTIPFNWIILADKSKIRLKRKRLKVIFHKPISTDKMTLEDIGYLKNKTFDIINEELKKHNQV